MSSNQSSIVSSTRLCAPKRVTLTPPWRSVRLSEGERLRLGQKILTVCPAEAIKRPNRSVEIASPPRSGVYFSDRRAIFMAEQCEMIIGYLVPHRCDNPSLGTCIKCGRGYCDEHTNQTKEGRVCLACLQGLDQPIALPIAAATFTATDLDTFNRASMWDDVNDSSDMFSDLS